MSNIHQIMLNNQTKYQEIFGSNSYV